MLNRDFSDILSEFIAAKVEFLLVGAYAMAAHGLPRATGDIDLWVRCNEENARRIVSALARFGAPMDGITAEDFVDPRYVFQLGVSPCRIDVLTAIDGVEFAEAWPDRVLLTLGGLEVPVPVISREHLLQNKRSTGRAKDVVDAEWLEGRRRSGR
jgi:hypothetical protein